MKKQIQILIGICVLLLFISAHFLTLIYFFTKYNYVVWMGIHIHFGLIIDLCIYSALILQMILIVSLIPKDKR